MKKLPTSEKSAYIGLGLLVGLTISLGLAMYFFVELQDLRYRTGVSTIYDAFIHFAGLEDD